MKRSLLYSSLIVFLGFGFTSHAQVLSEPEVFYRCYSHIVGKRPTSSNKLLQQVKSNQISVSNACMSLLEKASLSNNGVLQNVNDHEAVSVLNNFTKLHMGFFQNKTINAGGRRYRNAADIFDEQYPALTYSMALLKSDYDIDDILSGKDEYEGVREDGRPDRGVSSNLRSSDFNIRDNGNYYDMNASVLQAGTLIGARKARNISSSRFRGDEKKLIASFGGGLIGSRTYNNKNTPENISGNPNGADNMRRMWSQAVLKDFLCKDLPAVRLADGQPYKSPEADSVFRRSTGCIQCHATMDQLAAGARGLRKARSSDNNTDFRYPYLQNVDRDDSQHWPIKSDGSYHRRPAKGVLYYRSYTGELVKTKFSDFSSLANAIKDTDDYYACTAKRYYEYFTGVNASLADIHDPFSTVQLNKEDMFHRNEVIRLGKILKETKNLKDVVEAIIKSDQYRSHGYTLIQGDK